MGRREDLINKKLIRRIVSLQKFHGGLQHLQSRIAARQPVIFLFECDEFDGFTGALQGLAHQFGKPPVLPWWCG